MGDSDWIQRMREWVQASDKHIEVVRHLVSNLKMAREIETAGQLLRDLKSADIVANGKPIKTLRIGILSSFTPLGLENLLRSLLLSAGIFPEFYVAGFNQWAMELHDPQSGLAQFQPQLTLSLLHESLFLPFGWNPAELDQVRKYAFEQLTLLEESMRNFLARSKGSVVLHTVPLPAIEWNSVLAIKNKAWFGRFWRELNMRILDLSDLESGYVIDLESMLTHTAVEVRDSRLFQFAEMAWTSEVLLLMAEQVTALCRAQHGSVSKCLVLDLDNTLWGGVVGDDGPSRIAIGGMYPGKAYKEVQRRAKMLQQQGVILAICSKNEQSIVEEVFQTHEEFVLRLEDFAVVEANWQPKDENVRRIAERLNIGLDSLVFVDDSSFECTLVREHVPEVNVVQLGSEPAEHAQRVFANGAFAGLVTTETDRNRTAMYKAQAERAAFAESISGKEDYLRKLDIRVSLYRVDESAIGRVAQLSQRTNQFNMTTRRWDDGELRGLLDQEDALVMCFESSDRFGKEGIVGAVWVTKRDEVWKVENFIMSCRVFSRHIEHAVLCHVMDLARQSGATTLESVFSPTPKNKVASGFYANAGFEKVGESEEGTIHYARSLANEAPLMPEWINLTFERKLVGYV